MTGWSAAAEYERSFGRLCEGAVPALLAAVGRPARLLDVGTGPGTAAAAARATVPLVVAVDADPGMVALARRRLPGVDVRLAALPVLPFADDEFDAVVANFVVNHLPDPREGVRELLRLGHRVAVTVWPSEVGVLNRLWNDVRARAGSPPGPAERLAGALDFARTPAGLSDLLRSAGASASDARPVSWTFRIDPDLLWSGVEAGVARIGAAWHAADGRLRLRMRQAFDDLAAPMRDGPDLVVEVGAVLGVASRPPAGRPRPPGAIGPARAADRARNGPEPPV